MISKFKNPCNKCIVKAACTKVCKERHSHGTFIMTLDIYLIIFVFIQPFPLAHYIAKYYGGRWESLICVLLSCIVLCTMFIIGTMKIAKHKDIYTDQLHRSIK